LISYFEESLYKFLSILPIYFSKHLEETIPNWEYFENHIKALAEDDSEVNIQRLCAKRYLHNKSEREKAEKDSSYVPRFIDHLMLPLKISNDSKVDLVFMHGNESH